MTKKLFSFGCVIALLAGLCAPLVATAENGYTLSVEDQAPPEELEAEIRERIAPKVYKIGDADGVFFDVWLVPELKASAVGASNKETLDKVEEISLIGAIVVHREKRYDFRDDPIDPGTYILRMALQPQDGDHMGTSPYDTFAILMPLDAEAELKEYRDHETMVDLASEGTIAEHPPILALQPMANAEGEFPRMGMNEEDEWYFVCLKFPVKVGDETVELPVQFVFEGIGEL